MLSVTPRERVSRAVISCLLAVLLGVVAVFVTAQLALDRLEPGWFWVAVVSAGGALLWLAYGAYQLVRVLIRGIRDEWLDRSVQVM